MIYNFNIRIRRIVKIIINNLFALHIFFLFRSIRSDQNIIMLNLCGSLISSYAIFISVVEQTENEVHIFFRTVRAMYSIVLDWNKTLVTKTKHIHYFLKLKYDERLSLCQHSGCVHCDHGHSSLFLPGYPLQYAGNWRLLLHAYISHVLRHACGKQFWI